MFNWRIIALQYCEHMVLFADFFFSPEEAISLVFYFISFISLVFYLQWLWQLRKRQASVPPNQIRTERKENITGQ